MEYFKEKIYQIIKNMDAEFFTVRQLYGILQTHSTAERRAVTTALKELERDCLVIFDSRNRRYRKVTEGDFGTAEFCANARGFGFLLMEDGSDLFVPASKTHGAFHRDRVMYRRIKGTADEAEIVKILSRGMTHLVGTFNRSQRACFVLPDDERFISDVFIPPKKDLGAHNGQKVAVRITCWPEDNRNCPEGEVEEVLGYPDDKNVDIKCVALSFGLSEQFPPQVQKAVETLPQNVRAQDIVGRRDLRSERIFTIDGEDAKDLDDAVSVSMQQDGTFKLGVHIADVSHYVQALSPVDEEAFKRGTSVYLPGEVIPMLPKQLSNGICSLYEGEDRLTLTCEMTVDGSGKVVDSDIFPSVINSRHRMTYTAVQAILDGEQSVCRAYADIVQDLRTMERLAKILQAKRAKRGNIEFESREVVFVQDENGQVADVKLCDDSFSHKLIEEFMILANETVAEYAFNCSYPFVYRVHAKPDENKLGVLFALLDGLGINVRRTREIHNSVLQEALVKAEQTPYFNLVNEVMLRTMQKAKYSDVNSGHFGLASRCYCHFTSPIRRYPDLLVHRVLKTAIYGKMTEKVEAQLERACSDGAKQSSVREKIADEAERKAQDVKKCAYAERIVGQSFEAVVSGVTERGIYAELANTVEGFIDAEKLGFRLKYDPERFCLYDENVRYRLGDRVTVTVVSVNRQACKIDFDLAQNVDNGAKSV